MEITKNLKIGIAFLFNITLLSLPIQCVYADSVVTQWNDVHLDTIRHSKFGPTVYARSLAVVHTCMYDAWAAYDKDAVGTRPDGPMKQQKGTIQDKEKAVSFAAYYCLLNLYPSNKSDFDNLMTALKYDVNDVSAPAMVAGLRLKA